MLNRLGINSALTFIFTLIVALFLSASVSDAQSGKEKFTNLTPSEQNLICKVPADAFNPADLMNDHWVVVLSHKDPQGRLWGFGVNTKPRATVSHSLAIFEYPGTPPSVVIYLEGNKLRFLHLTADAITYEWDSSVDKKTYDIIAQMFVKAWPVLGHVLIKGDSI